jgi:rhamnosyltransferase
MDASKNVAILLATYNGSRFVTQQIRSLTENATPFTLHWLDDHSTDRTRDVVRDAASSSHLRLVEWHQPEHIGLPGVFFRLLESVEADIYLFCDQDDIWQPGKIDATVNNLLPDAMSPVLCFSEALAFWRDDPTVLRGVFDLVGADRNSMRQKSRTFTSNPAQGNTIGFTRPLREIFLSHKEVAHAHAASHDFWMYLIAEASGSSRMLSAAPTTLYRLHDTNAFGAYLDWKGLAGLERRWRLQRALRLWFSRQASGFCIAAETLPPGRALDRLVALARVVATLGKRQSLWSLFQLLRLGAMPPGISPPLWFAAACMTSDATRGSLASPWEGPSPHTQGEM